MKYIPIESYVNSGRTGGDVFQEVYSGSLRGAKMMLSKKQVYAGTKLWIEQENGLPLAYKYPGERWQHTGL